MGSAVLPLLLAVLLLAAPAQAGEAAAEARPSDSPLIIRDPNTLPPLEDLIRAGLEDSARGDLAGASRAWERIREHYPEHPAGPVYEIHTLEARKSLDVQDDRYDAALRAKANEAIALAEAWLSRVPNDPEAHFYAGRAKYALMIVTGMAGEYYRAGTTGERGRQHLERALELDPSLVDAKLPLGSYYYYTSVASRFIRWFSWLWFVPTGEHDLGLAYVQEASHDGDLLRFDADMKLVQFYLYLEDRPDLTAPILTRLHERYPENSQIAFEVVELRLLQGNYAGAIEQALALERSRGTQFGDATRRTMAKLWRARAELLRGRLDRAEAVLEELEQRPQALSSWSTRWLLLTRGHLEDVRGRRDEAIAYYERVIELKSRWDSVRSVKLARQGLEQPFRLEPTASAAVIGALQPPRSEPVHR